MISKNINDYKRSSKLCSKPLVFETKETLVIKEGDIFKDKEGDIFKDKTKSSINHEIPRRDV